jgi:hypothetical protein
MTEVESVYWRISIEFTQLENWRENRLNMNRISKIYGKITKSQHLFHHVLEEERQNWMGENLKMKFIRGSKMKRFGKFLAHPCKEFKMYF